MRWLCSTAASASLFAVCQSYRCSLSVLPALCSAVQFGAVQRVSSHVATVCVCLALFCSERVLTDALVRAGFCDVQRVGSFNLFLDASESVVMDVAISLNVIARPCGIATAEPTGDAKETVTVTHGHDHRHSYAHGRGVVLHNCSAFRADPVLEYHDNRRW